SRVRHACHWNWRQLVRKMNTKPAHTNSKAGRCATRETSSPSPVASHSIFSTRGRCCSPKRQVNRQKAITYSTKAMLFRRECDSMLSNGQASVARIVAMYTTQHSDISAYQPNACSERRRHQTTK